MREMVDREREQKQLAAAGGSPPSLVFVIGRRRVGKSFLLTRTFDAERTVYFQGDEQGERQHLDLLAAEAGRRLLGTPALQFGTWDDAFEFFGTQAARDALTLILDEFQWLKVAQDALDSILQRHWDRWDRDGVPITVVLSGSALTMMERLLEDKAPLYGRAKTRMRLEPLDYRDAAAFADDQEPEQMLRRWAVVGGTPQYQLWAGPGDVHQVIRERILAKDAPLYDDPRHLLREGEGMRDPGTYLAMLRAIAGGATQHNQIAQKSGVPTGNLVRRLDRLEDLGYIERVFPLAWNGKEKRTVYQISDPYFRFWFRYVAGNRSRLEAGRVDEVAAEIDEDLDNLMGWAFEQVCRRWARTYADDGDVGSPRDVGTWWSRDGQTEIDVVGVDGKRYVLLGSCKWRRIADTDVLVRLQEHQDVLGGKAARAKLVVFAREGFTEQLERQAAEEGVTLVNGARLFG